MIVGITGGVGTGKSTILQILKDEYNAAVIMADDVAKELMEPGQPSYRAVVEYFGTEILSGGEGSPIDRGKLAGIVFSDPDKLSALNLLTHPLVRIRILELIDEYKRQDYHLIIVESAILIQAHYLDFIDELWVVYADHDTRVDRLISSRGYTVEKIDNIISNQLGDDEMKRYASFLIDNTGTIDDVRRQLSDYLKRRGSDARDTY